MPFFNFTDLQFRGYATFKVRHATHVTINQKNIFQGAEKFCIRNGLLRAEAKFYVQLKSVDFDKPWTKSGRTGIGSSGPLKRLVVPGNILFLGKTILNGR